MGSIVKSDGDETSEEIEHCNKAPELSVDDNTEEVDIDDHNVQQSYLTNHLFQTECLGWLKGKIMLRRKAVLT